MQELKMPGNITDIDKYLIDRMDRIESKIDAYFTVQEEKITKLRCQFSAAFVILSLATTLISSRLVTAKVQPALPVERAQTKR